MQSLNQKLEKAAAKLVDALPDLGVAALKGLSTAEKTLPSVTVAVTGGHESPIGSGNFILSLAVECRSPATGDYTVRDHEDFCEEALEPFMSDGLASELTSAEPGFAVWGITNRSSRQSVEDTAFITELSMDVVCCNGAI